MNSLFGGVPLGAGKQTSNSGSDTNNNTTTTNNGNGKNTPSATGGGLGGWGSMFKNALNQVETHLDRYLELPNEPGAVSGAASVRTRQLSHSRSMRSLRQPPDSRSARPAGSSNTPKDDDAGASRPHSRIAQSGDTAADSDSALSPTASLNAKLSHPFTSQMSRSVDDARVRSHSAQKQAETTQGDDIDSNLLDAFGIDLDDGQKPPPQDIVKMGAKQSIESPQKPTSSSTHGASSLTKGVDEDRNIDDASGESEETAQADQTQIATNGAATLNTDTSMTKQTPATAAQSSVDNPYIQEELRKLREAQIPGSPEKMRAVIEQYSQRIEALLLEGQQWSAKELRLSNVIKKLRADNKNYERAAGSVQKKLDAAVSRNDDLNEKLKRASLTDRSTTDNIKALKNRLQAADTQRRTLERDLDSLTSARNTLSTALSAAESEAGSLRNELATTKAQYGQELQKAKEEARKEAAMRITNSKAEAGASQQRLQAQLDELQQRLMVVEEETRDREVSLLTQIRTLQAQLRSTELQNSDRGDEIQQHTLPLIQQLEELRMRQTEQRHEWTKKENGLSARARDLVREINDLKTQLDARAAELAEARDNIATEAKGAVSARQESDRLRQQLQAEIKIRSDMKRQLEDAHGNVRRLTTKLDELASLRSTALGTAAPESTAMAYASAELPTAGTSSMSPPSRLATEPVIAERGAPAASLANRHGRNISVSSVSSNDSRHRRSSAADSTGTVGVAAVPSTSDSAAATHAATKKLSAQVTSLKAQLQTALKQKNEFSRNLVELSLELEKARTDGTQLQGAAKELEELKRRHETALEMLGEKTEQVMELQADISEIKEAYKEQIQSLLRK
ncbi:TATA element modulatory factor 1 TATA binding-domain-containing protein [Coemansia spiralis]|nr:TATA element modulatory factor 1 TATA binding-domain-containing protein [Coemansia spiralis]